VHVALIESSRVANRETFAMTMNSTHRAAIDWRHVLWLLIALAFLMRLWGIWYGLPFSYWTDEYHELMRAMQLGAGSFNFARSSKGGFYLLLFFEYGLYFVILKIAGVVESTRQFAELFARDPTAFYLIGRATAALLGTVTVLAVFWLCRLAFSTAAGLIAAVFLTCRSLTSHWCRRTDGDAGDDLSLFRATNRYAWAEAGLPTGCAFRCSCDNDEASRRSLGVAASDCAHLCRLIERWSTRLGRISRSLVGGRGICLRLVRYQSRDSCLCRVSPARAGTLRRDDG
jgi:hypothetical protein